MLIIDTIIFFTLIAISFKKKLNIGFIAITGLLIYSLILKKPISEPSLDIALIILSVIIATSTLTASGGTILISNIIEKWIEKHKSFIEIIAPLFTFFITILCGTPYIVLTIIPIVIRISIKENIKPVYTTTGCIIAANHGYLCSPIGSPFIVISHLLKINRYYILSTLIFSCFIGLLCSILYNFIKQKCSKDTTNIYNKNIMNNIPEEKELEEQKEEYDKKKAKKAVFIFVLLLVVMLIYGLNDNIKPYIIKNSNLSKCEMTILIPLFMFTMSVIIRFFCNINLKNILEQKTMEYGMKSFTTIVGISWLSNTLIENNKNEFLTLIKDVLNQNTLILGLVLFLASVFMASQTAAILIFISIYITVGIEDITLLKIIPFVDGLFFIPLTAIFSFAVECDKTNSTKSGDYIFNHSLMVPGFIATSVSAIVMNYIVK